MYGSVRSDMAVTLTVAVNLRGPVKEVTHTAEAETTVQEFISELCEQHGIPYNGDILLSSEDGLVFKKSQTLNHYGLTNGSVVKLVTWDTGHRKGRCCNQWWLLAFIAFLIGVAGIAAIVTIRITNKRIPDSYGIVFDAGSSHTQMYIYQWEGSKENGTAVPQQVYTKRAEGGGISEYTDKPEQAGEAILNLVHDARKQIPGSQFQNTDLYLGATAGMRLLKEKDPETSKQIMNSIKDSLLKSPFSFNYPEAQSRIIEGKEEGSFAWATVNYLEKKFETFNTGDTYGSLDLGGASTQIAFVANPREIVDTKYLESLVLYGYEYEVYTNSYLCYGSNEAHRQYLATLVVEAEGSTTITDPCLPKGNSSLVSYEDVFEAPCTNKMKPANKTADNYTFEGSSDSDKCNEIVQKIFNFTAPCDHVAEKCTFDGGYQPALTGQFRAFSQFYYTMEFLNVSSEASLKDFRKATEDFCSLSWEEVKDLVLPPGVLMYVSHYCFNAHFIDILLTKGYKFNDTNWKSIKFTKKIEGTDLGWSLGFMTNTSNSISPQFAQETVGLTMFIIYMVLFSVFLLLAVAFACHARQARRTSAHTPYARLEA